jgi:hypothetical protein
MDCNKIIKNWLTLSRAPTKAKAGNLLRLHVQLVDGVTGTVVLGSGHGSQ